MTRPEALIVLLAQPMPAECIGIGYRYTQPRDAKRDRDIVKRDLKRAYVEWSLQDHVDQSTVISVRRQKGAHTVIRLAGWRRA